MKYAEKIHLFALDILFPTTCLGCESEGMWLCEKCASNLAIKGEHVCPICEKVPTPGGRACFDCKKKSSLEALLTVFPYDLTLVRRAVHFYKYRFIQQLHLPLGTFLTSALLRSDLPVPDMLIPVPLHPRRLRWRGFNQSLLLAEKISGGLTPGLAIPVRTNVITRTKYTQPQMGIKDKTHRQQNIKDAFALVATDDIRGKNILLVDDIATTCSTLFECARILKEAGAKQVWAIVIARQEIKKKTK